MTTCEKLLKMYFSIYGNHPQNNNGDAIGILDSYNGKEYTKYDLLFDYITLDME